MKGGSEKIRTFAAALHFIFKTEKGLAKT